MVNELIILAQGAGNGSVADRGVGIGFLGLIGLAIWYFWPTRKKKD